MVKIEYGDSVCFTIKINDLTVKVKPSKPSPVTSYEDIIIPKVSRGLSRMALNTYQNLETKAKGSKKIKQITDFFGPKEEDSFCTACKSSNPNI